MYVNSLACIRVKRGENKLTRIYSFVRSTNENRNSQRRGKSLEYTMVLHEAALPILMYGRLEGYIG